MLVLDPRIKDRKYIFDCFNADEAKKYIGKKCYMTDRFDQLSDVESTAKAALGGIDDDGFFLDSEGGRFTFCIPFEAVAPKKKEKKYRPYTFEEFHDVFPIGGLIKYRERYAVEGREIRKRHLILNGYWNSQSEDKIYVCIGPISYTLEDLFDVYEWEDPFNGDWRPFGAEVAG